MPREVVKPTGWAEHVVRYIRIAVGLLVAAAGLAAAVAGPRNASTPSVVAVGSRVADWQLAHMGNFDYIPAGPHRVDAEKHRDWVQAAFYIGLSHFADAVGNPRYVDAVM